MISVVIITNNEAARIDSIVRAWARCGPVFVIDSDSSDGTASIAKTAGAEVFTQPWLGFGRQKQWAVWQATSDWVLSVDADEWPTEGLIAEIHGVNLTDPTIAYSLRRENYFLGKLVRYGGWGGDRVVRLFNRRVAQFSDRLVHESVVGHCKAVHLKHPIRHESYCTQNDITRKIALYGTLAAQERAQSKAASSLFTAQLRAMWAFIRTFIIRLGFLDGRTGFDIAVMNMRVTALKYRSE